MISSVSSQRLSDFGRKNMKKHIKKFGISEVIEATKISISQYHKGKDENITKVIDYIPKICQNRKLASADPIYAKKQYIKGIMKNRFGIYNDKRVAIAFNEVITSEDIVEKVMYIAKQANNWTEFWHWFNETFDTFY
jgi:hypothetical protein